MNNNEKMKWKTGTKAAAVFAAFILGAGALLGCSFGKPTAESLLAASSKQVAEMKTADVDLDFHFDMEIEQGIIPIPLQMDMEGDIRYVREDMDHYKTETKGDIDVSAFGFSSEAQTVNYTVCEDGEVTSYTKKPDSDMWIKQSRENAKIQAGDMSQISKILSVISLFTLQEDTVMENDTECYVLTAEITGSDIPVFDNDVNLDLDRLKMYLTYKLNKKTKSPVSLLITADQDSLEELLEESLGKNVRSVNVNRFDVELLFVSIDEDFTIDVPDEVYEAQEGEEQGVFDSLDSFLFGISGQSGKKE